MNRQIYNLSQAVENEITNFTKNQSSGNYMDYHLEQMLAKKMRYYLEYAYNLGTGAVDRERVAAYAYNREPTYVDNNRQGSRIRGMNADMFIMDEFETPDPFEIQEIIDSL